MEQFLGKKLAMIELDFLSQLSEDSNNDLFMLFKWIIEMETSHCQDESADLQLVVLNDQQIFHKARGEKSIDIYTNNLPLKPHTKKQWLMVCLYKPCKEKEKIAMLMGLLLRFLQENNSYFRVVTDYSGISLSNGLLVEEVIEVSM